MFELQFDLPGWFWWEIAEWILKSSIFMSFHGLLVLTPVWLGQMGRIGLGSPNRSPSSRYYLGSQFLFIPAHQSFLQGTCFLRPTLDQCAMVTHGTACASWRSQNCWKWTCGQSIWDSTPTFLWSVGEHQFICTAVTGSVRGSSLRLVFTLLPRRSCFVQPDGGLAGVGVTLGRFNDAGLGPYKALKPMVWGLRAISDCWEQSWCKKPTMIWERVTVGNPHFATYLLHLYSLAVYRWLYGWDTF